MGVIYKLTFPNGKSYIGKTTRTIEERTKEHNLPSNKCPALNRAIQKYSTYETEILIEIDDSLLNDYEEEFILTYNTIVPNGYNLTYGGDGGKHCEETKQKLRLSKLGTKLSDETKENMRKAHSNRIVSEFWKKRISEGLKGHLVSDETRQKISNAKKCNPTQISDETREKMRNSLSTLEVRERMSRNHRKPENSHLPMYVRKIRKTRPSNNTIYTGYAVCFPGKGEKYFVSSKLSDEEKLQLAIEYINNNGDGPTTK